MLQRHADRLLAAAEAVEQHPRRELFTMERYGWFAGQLPFHEERLECDTPACVMGCYASRTDLQDFLTFSGGDLFLKDDPDPVSHLHIRVREHFGLTWDETDELFGEHGCGGAKTPEEAAQYIREFVANKLSPDVGD